MGDPENPAFCGSRKEAVSKDIDCREGGKRMIIEF
jgi:hypothetical protein